MTKPIVYIPQEPVRLGPNGPEPMMDLRPAAEFGELRVLLDAGARLLVDPRPAVQALHAGLEVFRPEDYLLAVGAPTLIGWATAIAAVYAQGRVTMLVWAGKTRRYSAVTADLWLHQDPIGRKAETDEDNPETADESEAYYEALRARRDFDPLGR